MSEESIDKKFEELTPTYPNERIMLEHKPEDATTRILDMISPIGKGQRCLLVSPPKAGKTTIMQKISEATAANHPEINQFALLIDERPEEITDFERNTPCEVISSSSDRDPENHVKTSQSVLRGARRRLVEGEDVLILLDSITRYARAHNLVTGGNGRTLSGGLDSSAMKQPRKFFGAARNVEDGGSLTIVGTALVETGSQMDEVIFQEFKGTGNMELVLKRRLAEKRFYPAISVSESGTRKEEKLFNENENRIISILRRYLGSMDDEKALRFLLEQVENYTSNGEFLQAIAKGELQMPGVNTEGI